MDKCKKKSVKESNKNAAWANTEKKKDKTNVPVPTEDSVELAKDWVEENEK